MNFTNSPYEKMMKEIPRPGRGGGLLEDGYCEKLTIKYG